MFQALTLPFLLLVAGLFGESKKDLTRRPTWPGPTRRPARRATAARAVATPVRRVRRRTTVRPRQPSTAAKPRVVPVARTIAVPVQPAPWPQVVPAGLPSFPGAKWVPDNPPGPGVVARAKNLLMTLWAHGPGTFKTEQTAGRWITYRATPMGKKKGVVAFKLVSEPPRQWPEQPHPQNIPPSYRQASTAPETPLRRAGRIVSTAPAASPRASRVALPTLRRGPPWLHMPETRILQGKLGLTPDGKFGKNTEAAVRSYQASKGLVPDGVVGRNTWAALMGG